MKHLTTMILLLGCLTGCSLIKGEEAVIKNLCTDANAACASALLVCTSSQERAALARSNSEGISRSVLQCNKVHEVCDNVTVVCAAQK